MTKKMNVRRGPQSPSSSGEVACPRCGKPASAQHFKENETCAAMVARLRAMLNVSQRKHVVAGPGRPKGSKTKAQKKGATK